MSDLLASATTQELREAAAWYKETAMRGHWDELAAAALSLIAEGRESGAFARMTHDAHYDSDCDLLRALAGTDE